MSKREGTPSQITVEGERVHRSISTDVTGLTAFIAFVIIYNNLIFSVDAFGLVRAFNIWPPFSYIPAAILLSPWFLAAASLWEFVGSLARYIERLFKDETPDFVTGLYIFGIFVGTLVFVVVISIFVAYQSQAYLDEISEPLKTRLWGFFGK